MLGRFAVATSNRLAAFDDLTSAALWDTFERETLDAVQESIAARQNFISGDD